LGDFGIARVLSNTKSQAQTVVGTPYYLSPEIIEGKGYSFESDIWSLGILLFELCALQPPFLGGSLHILAKSILTDPIPPIPSHYTSVVVNLIKAMLQRDAKLRPTINQILKHPHIAKRIQYYLGDQDFKDEFSHTILHNQDAFKTF
jgi:NIMA (never in mitosis gene a)-related kinase